MHRMTRDGNVEGARAPFDGAALRFKGDVVRLETHAGARYVRIERAGTKSELYRITRIIGGRQREDFAGVRVQNEMNAALDVAAGGEELVLPISYLIFSKTLRYKGYSVLLHERSTAQAGPVWDQTCIFCHNTVPFFSTILGALAEPRAPHYQGEDVDTLLPDARRWKWSVGDPRALGDALRDETAHLGASAIAHDTSPRDALREAIGTTRARFTARDLVDVGIGCEACHNGAREHLANPAILPSFLPHSPAIDLATGAARDPEAARAQAIDRVCARCHQVLFSRYPWTWEGGKRHSAVPGGSTINSGEARDFLLGGCASALACTACHEPHESRDRAAKNEALAAPSGNAVCTRCHAELAGDSALRGHARHDPRGAGGACIACHMPRKNMGLDTQLTRYHRIGSPTDPERVIRDRPLECALCHAEATTESLLRTMERWWNKAYPREEITRLYGNLEERNLMATLARGKPHEQAVAAVILGEKHDRNAATAIARQLVNEYPLVRAFAARALDEALGANCKIDVTTDAAQIEQGARACLATAGLRDSAWPGGVPPVHGGDNEVPED